MKTLYEVLVPTIYGYPKQTPIRTKHHKNWDAFVQSVTGGLTILSPASGRWLNKGIEYPEKVIPVRIMCEETIFDDAEERATIRDTSQIDKIIKFTLSHYRQKAVMYYKITNEVFIVTA